MTEEITMMIIGAGGTGRLLAHALKKRGIKPVLFEKDKSLDARPRDWDYGVYWAADLLPALLPPHIDTEKILTAQTDHIRPSPDSKIMAYRSDTGALLAALPIPNSLRLRKREFCRVLDEGLDIQYNKRLIGVQQEPASGTVKAIFADGTTHSASFILATDGTHSSVRSYLVGEEKAHALTAPISMACAHCRLPPAQTEQLLALTDRTAIAYSPDNRFAWLSVHDAYGKPKKEDWLFSFIVCYRTGDGPDSSATGNELLCQMKACCAGYAEPWKTMTEALLRDEHAWATPVYYWPTEPWPGHPARGRVTLLGDAMHALVPRKCHRERGQGMNNAILDVVDFMKEIDAEGPETIEVIKEAIKRYEETAWKRGTEVVMESLTNGMMVTDWEKLQESPLMKYALSNSGNNGNNQ
ncbi:FAD/NAD(P)-binding domain-containing protein [Thozetella sp. PMI_491]|nr:FAD/NAD(P)-binding domain-containing protein [Thozetella sp. PMI_491]